LFDWLPNKYKETDDVSGDYDNLKGMTNLQA